MGQLICTCFIRDEDIRNDGQEITISNSHYYGIFGHSVFSLGRCHGQNMFINGRRWRTTGMTVPAVPHLSICCETERFPSFMTPDDIVFDSSERFLQFSSLSGNCCANLSRVSVQITCPRQFPDGNRPYCSLLRLLAHSRPHRDSLERATSRREIRFLDPSRTEIGGFEGRQARLALPIAV
jgi:hypothetical protein